MLRYSPTIRQLISQLGSLPGIGNKTAQRLAFHILSAPEDKAYALGNAIIEARKKTRFCASCCNLCDDDLCPICMDDSRNKIQLMVVENPNDVSAMERTDKYKGRYHVLHGALSPMKNIGAADIKITELVRRLTIETDIQELILATNATLEGEATANYIARLLSGSGIEISRIAHGIPMGSNLEYADELTLAKAFDGRLKI